MIVWILALPAALSAALGVTAKFVAVPFFAACMLGSAGWCAKLLRGYGPLGSGAASSLCRGRYGPAGASRTRIRTARASARGRRSALSLHIRASASMERQRTPVDETIAGILAGFGCALKPQFLFAFALLEIVGRIHGLQLLRRMTISAAVTVLVYFAALLVTLSSLFHQRHSARAGSLRGQRCWLAAAAQRQSSSAARRRGRLDALVDISPQNKRQRIAVDSGCLRSGLDFGLAAGGKVLVLPSPPGIHFHHFGAALLGLGVAAARDGGAALGAFFVAISAMVGLSGVGLSRVLAVARTNRDRSQELA